MRLIYADELLAVFSHRHDHRRGLPPIRLERRSVKTESGN